MAFFTVVYTFLEKMDFIKVITFQCMTSSFKKAIYSELCVGENTLNVAAISFFFYPQNSRFIVPVLASPTEFYGPLLLPSTMKCVSHA